jgi:hypothetical protein
MCNSITHSAEPLSVETQISLLLLGEHLFNLLITKCNFMYRITLSFEGFEVAFDIGGKEDL